MYLVVCQLNWLPFVCLLFTSFLPCFLVCSRSWFLSILPSLLLLLCQLLSLLCLLGFLFLFLNFSLDDLAISLD